MYWCIAWTEWLTYILVIKIVVYELMKWNWMYTIVWEHWSDTPELHGPMHYKGGITGVYNGHVSYTLL